MSFLSDIGDAVGGVFKGVGNVFGGARKAIDKAIRQIPSSRDQAAKAGLTVAAAAGAAYGGYALLGPGAAAPAASPGLISSAGANIAGFADAPSFASTLASGATSVVGGIKSAAEIAGAVLTSKIAIDTLTGKSRQLGTGEAAPPGWQVYDVPVPAATGPPAAVMAQPAPASNALLLLLLGGAVLVFSMR